MAVKKKQSNIKKVSQKKASPKKMAQKSPEKPAEAPSYSSVKSEIMLQISDFKNSLVKKYQGIHGYDMRKEIAWFLEQSGLSLDKELETEKRIEREKNINNNLMKDFSATTVW